MRCGQCGQLRVCVRAFACAWQMLRTIKTFRYRVVSIQRWWRVNPSTQPPPAARTTPTDGSDTRGRERRGVTRCGKVRGGECGPVAH